MQQEMQSAHAVDNETIDWCRLCLRSQVPSKSIFAKESASEKIRSRILDCCPITLFEDHRLPNSICQRCESKLDVTYEFRQLCRESERVLRTLYEPNYRDRSGTWYASATSCDSYRNSGTRTDDNVSIEAGKLNNGHDERGNSELGFADRIAKRTKGKSRDKVVEDPKGTSKEGCRKELERGLKRELTGVSRNAEQWTVTTSFGSIHKNNNDGAEIGCRVEERGPNRSGNSSARTRGSSDEDDPIIDSEERSMNTNVTGTGERKGKSYLCDLCNKTFASKSGLRFHFKSHNGIKPHSCQHCGKRFAIPSYLKRHERIHTGKKELVCQFCSAAFASSNGLRYHLRSHTGESNYRCETCGKSFRRYKYLKEHVFTHTGEKPFVCKRCGTAYANSGSLFVHEKRCKMQHADSILGKL